MLGMPASCDVCPGSSENSAGISKEAQGNCVHNSRDTISVLGLTREQNGNEHGNCDCISVLNIGHMSWNIQDTVEFEIGYFIVYVYLFILSFLF